MQETQTTYTRGDIWHTLQVQDTVMGLAEALADYGIASDPADGGDSDLYILGYGMLRYDDGSWCAVDAPEDHDLVADLVDLTRWVE